MRGWGKLFQNLSRNSSLIKTRKNSRLKFAQNCSLIGNAGSGKTTLALKIQKQTQARILDLDNITWQRGKIQRRRPIEDSLQDLELFIQQDSENFIIEGCYGELIERSLQHSPMLIFLDPGEKTCLENCRNRKWEQHKYATKLEQDKLLPFLLSWVSEYYRRTGPLSHAFHCSLFEHYSGPKMMINSVNRT